MLVRQATRSALVSVSITRQQRPAVARWASGSVRSPACVCGQGHGITGEPRQRLSTVGSGPRGKAPVAVPLVHSGKRVAKLGKENWVQEGFGLQQQHPIGPSALIAALGRQHDLERAFRVYNTELRSGTRQQQLNVAVINALVGACRRCGQPGRALSLLDDIERFNIIPNELCFHQLTAACGEAGDAVAAKRLLRWLQEGRLRFQANIVDFGQLIKAFLSRTADPESVDRRTRLADALSVLKLIEGQGAIAQAGRCFSMVFAACADQGEVEVGRQLHHLLLSNKVRLDNITVARLIGMYGACGHLNDAVAVYDALVTGKGDRPDLAIVNALVYVSRLCGQPGRALSLLDDMQRFHITPDELCFHQLAAACGEAGDAAAANRLLGWLQEGRLRFQANATDCGQLIKAFLSRTADPESADRRTRLADALSVLKLIEGQGAIAQAGHCFSMLLAACADQGEAEVGRQLHHLLLSNKVRLDNFVAAGLIGMYGACGHLNDSVAVYNALTTSGGRRPDVTVINALVNSYRQCGQPGRALSLLDDIVKSRIVPDELCFHQLAAACGEAGDAAAAKRLLGWLQGGRLLFQANATDCGQLIKAFLSRTDPESVDSSARLTDALSVLKLTEDQGIAVGSHCYSMLFAACADQGEVDVGRQLHARLLDRKYGLDDFLASGLISMYAKCGHLDDATAVFASMGHPQLGGTPPQEPAALLGSGSWSAMVAALGQHGQGKKALALFEQLMARPEGKVKPDSVSLVAVLNACSHTGLVEDALRIYHAIAEDGFAGVVPEIQHQNCVVDALGRAGQLSEAEQFITNNIGQPDEVTWRTLLGACHIHGDVILAERVANHLRALVPKDPASRAMLGNVYAGAGRWADQGLVRQQMKEDRVRKQPGVSWIVLDGKRHVLMVEDKGHPKLKPIHDALNQLWEQMKAAGFTPNTSVVTRQLEDEEAKERHLRQHSEKLAMALGIISTPPGTTLRVYNNLRVCSDCHEAAKAIARLTQREIIVRDSSRFHHFTVDGRCSCNNYW